MSRPSGRILNQSCAANGRGEVLVTMHLFGSRESYAVQDGDRIAQLVIAPVVALPVEEAEELSPTERGAGGHGSTGP